jgi:hypothetical protein
MKQRASYSAAGAFLAAHGKELYKNAVPDPVRVRLHDAAEAARNDELPPLVRIHVSQAYDWIPWEILHDDIGFLGLRFRIARLPIIPTPPVIEEHRPHPVRTVRSVLARNVIEDDAAAFDAWRGTFTDLVPDDAAKLLPPDMALEESWPTLPKLWEETDILHVTCHGGLKDHKHNWLYWTLNHRKPNEGWAYHVIPTYVEQLNLTRSQPLVFGNACASTGAAEGRLEAGLGTSFFKGGALNFIGTFAPITREAALRFARTFYEELLGGGCPIGDALWRAKHRHLNGQPEHADDPSFLFYCLYGPPDSRFESEGNGNGVAAP